MPKAHSGTDSSIGRSTDPSIECGRFSRAVIKETTIKRVAERFYEVHSQLDNTYEIDLQTGACTCPDCQQRADRYVCKHAIRASLVEIIANGVTTRTVAKVAVARERSGAVVDVSLGGTAVGWIAGVAGDLPCPTCCDATRTENLDEFDVWMTVVAPD